MFHFLRPQGIFQSGIHFIGSAVQWFGYDESFTSIWNWYRKRRKTFVSAGRFTIQIVKVRFNKFSKCQKINLFNMLTQSGRKWRGKGKQLFELYTFFLHSVHIGQIDVTQLECIQFLQFHIVEFFFFESKTGCSRCHQQCKWLEIS